jgi:excinuclease UvrABC ATPase subunit
VVAGTPEVVAQCKESLTGQFLNEKLKKLEEVKEVRGS